MNRSVTFWVLSVIVGLMLLVPSQDFLFASGELVIQEIMYDAPGTDTKHEWVEIFNTSNSEIVVTEWKLYEQDTNHGIVAYQGGDTLPPGGYAVIADDPATFLGDWPQFSGILFDSTFSLNNTGELLALKNGAGATVDEVTYSSSTGASGDGNSLNRSGGSFVVAAASPGGESSGSGTTNSGGSNNDPNTTENQTETTSSSDEGPSIAGIGVASGPQYSGTLTTSYPAVVFDPITVTATVMRKTVDGEARRFSGEFFYNFGDGETAWYEDGDPVQHVYEAPGTYTIYFAYYSSQLARATDSPLEMMVDVFVGSQPVVIVGIEGNHILLQNETNKRLDLGGWSIRGAAEEVYIPEHTYISSKASIALSLPFNLITASGITLSYPEGQAADFYSSQSESTTGFFSKNEDVMEAVSLPVITGQASKPQPIAEDKLAPARSLVAAAGANPVIPNTFHWQLAGALIILVAFLIWGRRWAERSEDAKEDRKSVMDNSQKSISLSTPVQGVIPTKSGATQFRVTYRDQIDLL